MVDIIAMTTLCVDIFDATGEIRPGGEALNFAAIASEYSHVNVGIIGPIGDDLYGKKILDSIREKSIDKEYIHVIRNGITANNRIYINEWGDRYFKQDSWVGGVYTDYMLTQEDVLKIQSQDLVFITYYSPSFKDIINLKKNNAISIAVDFDVMRDFDELEKYAPYIDYFFISGEESIMPIFREWSQKYNGIFNITLADEGSVSFYKGNEYRVKAVPVSKVVDTTGCGDSYHAGFICSYLKDGNIINAMNEGSKVASRTLSHIGGFC